MSQTQFTRREVLQIGGASLLATALSGSLRAQTTKPKQILYFTKSSGFEHTVVATQRWAAEPLGEDPGRDGKTARL